MTKEENLEKELFDLANITANGEGLVIIESDIIHEVEGSALKVIHKDGYCFDLTREYQYDEDDNMLDPYYDLHIADGFKDITVKEAIDLIKNIKSK